VRDSTITDNGYNGVRSERGSHVIDSEVTGNGTDGSCGVSTICADIQSKERPQVDGTTCETSWSYASVADWDVCSLDPM
jgi:hypothetical protein